MAWVLGIPHRDLLTVSPRIFDFLDFVPGMKVAFRSKKSFSKSHSIPLLGTIISKEMLFLEPG